MPVRCRVLPSTETKAHRQSEPVVTRSVVDLLHNAGGRASRSAIAAAVREWRSIRSPSVLIPCRICQAANGGIVEPCRAIRFAIGRHSAVNPTRIHPSSARFQRDISSRYESPDPHPRPTDERERGKERCCRLPATRHAHAQASPTRERLPAGSPDWREFRRRSPRFGRVIAERTASRSRIGTRVIPTPEAERSSARSSPVTE